MENDLVKIYTAYDHIQAEMAVGALENQQIPALRKELGNAGLLNIYGTNSMSGEEIYVPKESKEKAREVLIAIGFLGCLTAEPPFSRVSETLEKEK